MVSQTAEYALRAVVHLGLHYPAPQTNAAIAATTQVPGGYLPKIMLALARRRLVTSRRGLGGGFVLARAPDAISVLDVLVAVDAAPERITTCPLGLPGHEKLCPLHRLMDDSVAQINRAFGETTIASLLTSTQGALPLCPVPGGAEALAALAGGRRGSTPVSGAATAAATAPAPAAATKAPPSTRTAAKGVGAAPPKAARASATKGRRAR